MHTEDVPTKKYALTLLKKTKSLDYTKKVLEKYKLDVLKLIEQLGGNKELERIIDRLGITS